VGGEDLHFGHRVISRDARPLASFGPAVGAKGDETVIIQLRSIGRAEPDDLAAILPTLSEAAAAVDLDHSRIAVMLDWVQSARTSARP
jgi:hypothetical protein